MQPHRTWRTSSQTQQASPPNPRPFLLPIASKQSSRSLLSLWHLLSLDAPSVAAAWTWFIAYLSSVALPWTSSAAMYLVVWMLYAADRLLDARSHNSRRISQELEERHRFHAQHQTFFVIGMIAAALTLPFLLHSLSFTELRLYAALGSLLFAYFFLIHLWPLSERHRHVITPRLPKELAVGIFFAAAVFIPTVAREPNLRLRLLPFAILFACICTLNCLYVYVWEHPEHQAGAHWTTRFAVRHLPAITCVALLTSAIMAIALSRAFASIAIACGLSASCFFLLNSLSKRIYPTNLRAAVDLSLLTPLLILVVQLLTR